MSSVMTGVTGRFHARCNGVPMAPTGNCVTKGSYGNKEAFVPVEGGKQLHFLRDGDRFKVTVYATGKDGGINGTSALKLDPLTLDEVNTVIDKNVLRFGAMEHRLLNTRALRRIV